MSWRYGKYVTFGVILAIGFVNLPLAEMANEVEPFKTFVLRLARPSDPEKARRTEPSAQYAVRSGRSAHPGARVAH